MYFSYVNVNKYFKTYNNEEDNFKLSSAIFSEFDSSK